VAWYSCVGFHDRALRLSVIDPTETPEAEDAETGFKSSTTWWTTGPRSAKRSATIARPVPLVASQASYSLGTGGDWTSCVRSGSKARVWSERGKLVEI
jgi:hypothetical protein